MKTRRELFGRWGMVVLLAWGAAIAGCVPDSEHPITEIEEASVDEALVGTWKVVAKNGETHFLHIGRERHRALRSGRDEPEAGLMRFTFIVHGKQGGLEEPISGRFFVSQVGETKYANMVLPLEVRGSESQPAARYWIVKYEVDEQTLRIRGMDIRATAEAIERGLVEGTVERRDERLRRATLLAAGDVLQRFLASEEGKKLFPAHNETVYTRVP